jgi:predicted AlkP superfamily pyrophosphatase or phosphodiesterase
MKKIFLFFIFFCTALYSTDQSSSETNYPKLTVVIVIDQFANHYINKLKPHFNYAFKNLLENGIVYKNAQHPHGAPSTATGHLALNTGTLACKHGISSNKWLGHNNKKIKYEIDESENAKTFFDNKTGISPQHIMAEGLTDSFLAANKKNRAFALSYKTRAAVACASKRGKAIWFDKNTGNFTSSRYYFDQIPEWVSKFNQEKNPAKTKNFLWETLYKKDGPEYNFNDIDNYDFTRYNFSLINKPMSIDLRAKNPFEFFKKTPGANQHLIDLAKACLNQNLDKKTNQFLLWLSLSSLDPIGHCYGPDSLEVIDLIYHLDEQIQDFINFVQNKVGAENVLFVLTADHGVCHTPELLQKNGNHKATRILAETLTSKMNNFIKDKYRIENLVLFPTGISFFLDKEKLNLKDENTQKQILTDLIEFLKKEPGIKNAWLTQDLQKLSFKFDQPENFYKMQIYPSRTGPIVFQPKKYCFVSKKTKGTVHKTCHEYDTHVPLILYQKNKFEKKIIDTKVWMPQLAPTIAKIIGVPKPKSSEFEVLPGI